MAIVSDESVLRVASIPSLRLATCNGISTGEFDGPWWAGTSLTDPVWYDPVEEMFGCTGVHGSRGPQELIQAERPAGRRLVVVLKICVELATPLSTAPSSSFVPGSPTPSWSPSMSEPETPPTSPFILDSPAARPRSRPRPQSRPLASPQAPSALPAPSASRAPSAPPAPSAQFAQPAPPAPPAPSAFMAPAAPVAQVAASVAAATRAIPADVLTLANHIKALPGSKKPYGGGGRAFPTRLTLRKDSTLAGEVSRKTGCLRTIKRGGKLRKFFGDTRLFEADLWRWLTDENYNGPKKSTKRKREESDDGDEEVDAEGKGESESDGDGGGASAGDREEEVESEGAVEGEQEEENGIDERQSVNASSPEAA